jgi:hypothetical protein
MNASNCRELPKKQENVTSRKEVKEEAGNGNSSTENIRFMSGPDFQTYMSPRWAPW